MLKVAAIISGSGWLLNALLEGGKRVILIGHPACPRLAFHSYVY